MPSAIEKKNMGKRKIILALWNLVLSVIFLVFIFCRYYGAPVFDNGDIYSFSAFYKYVQALGNSTSDWLMPSAGYYSDFLLIFGLHSLNLSTNTMLAAAASIQNLLFVCAAYCLYASLTEKKEHSPLMFPALLLLATLFSYAGTEFYQEGVIVFHFLAFVYTLFIFSLYFSWDKAPSLSKTVFFILLASFAYFSDNIILVWCFLPLLSLQAIKVYKERSKKSLLLLLILIISLIIGKIAFSLIQSSMPSAYLDFQPSPSISRLLKQIFGVISLSFASYSDNLVAAALGALSGLGLLYLLSQVKKEHQDKRPFPGRYGELLLLVSFIIIYPIVAVSSIHVIRSRYLMPAILFPVLMSSFLLFPKYALQKSTKETVYYLGFILILGLFCTQSIIARRPALQKEYIYNLEKYLAENPSVKRGAAEFHHAHRVSALAKDNDLFVYPLDDSRLFIIQTNAPLNAPTDHYDYFLVEEESTSTGQYFEDLILAINGPPEERVPLGDGMVLLRYKDASIASRKHTFLQNNIFSHGKRPADAILWQGDLQLFDDVNIKEVRYVFRHQRAYVLFFFNAPSHVFLNKHASVAVLGDKTRKHRKFLWNIFENSSNSFVRSFLWRFFQPRTSLLNNTHFQDLEQGSVMVLRTSTRENNSLECVWLDLDGTFVRIPPLE